MYLSLHQKTIYDFGKYLLTELALVTMLIVKDIFTWLLHTDVTIIIYQILALALYRFEIIAIAS